MEKNVIITFKTSKLIKEKNIQINNPECFYYPDGEFEVVYTCTCNDLEVNECSCGANYLERDSKKYYPATTQTSLQKHIRDNYNIHISIDIDDLDWNYQLIDCSYEGRKKDFNHLSVSMGGFNSYEDALEDGLQLAITLIHNNQ